jgi:hypothetical protein
MAARGRKEGRKECIIFNLILFLFFLEGELPEKTVYPNYKLHFNPIDSASIDFVPNLVSHWLIDPNRFP